MSLTNLGFTPPDPAYKGNPKSRPRNAQEIQESFFQENPHLRGLSPITDEQLDNFSKRGRNESPVDSFTSGNRAKSPLKEKNRAKTIDPGDSTTPKPSTSGNPQLVNSFKNSLYGKNQNSGSAYEKWHQDFDPSRLTDRDLLDMGNGCAIV